MRNLLLAFLTLALTISLFAEKKDKYQDWKTGRVTNIKSQDMQSSSYSNPNGEDRTGRGAILPGAGNGGSAGGSFSSAPAHFIVYNVSFDTEEASYYLTLGREVTLRQPDLRAGSDFKFKQQGPKVVEIVDSVGKRFEFTIVKMIRKEPATTSQPK